MRLHRPRSLSAQHGFTVIELLVALGLTAVLLGLSVAPLRTFWFTQSLKGTSDALVGELRKQQEDSVSQAHPLIFGVGFTTGANQMYVYSFDPKLAGTADDTCTVTAKSFDSGAFNASVLIDSLTITNDTSAPEYVKCQQAQAADRIMFFYARGTSNGGTVVLKQPNTGKQRTVTVSGITGRVTRS